VFDFYFAKMEKRMKRLIQIASIALLAGCSAMTTLPDNQLQDTASAVVGKPMASVGNVRHLDDMSYFDATATDGTTYACSLQVVMGMTSQHQQCAPK
jgi:uncharacterized protein YunC (DUF1805 family)